MFGNKIIKTIFIEGMSCEHCSKRVEDALKSINEVKSVKISLGEKKAEVILKRDIDNEVIKTVIDNIGFKVVNIN